MSLRSYNQKRDFKKTAEPSGKRKASRQHLSFVVQKHDASHLHYDFRLEVGGVLKSWAVPKGPSLDPSQKRLAIQVEDHPYDYGDFEGTIPKGEYGGGTMMLWDRGEWIPEEKNPAQALKRGAIKFRLNGEKLSGKWTLIRMKNGEKAWLLIKEKDEFAKPLRQGDILSTKPLSVKTGRDLQGIASGEKVKHNKLKKIKMATKQKSLPKLKSLTNPNGLLQKLKKMHISNPEKIYYPEVGLRKIDLIEYFLTVSDRILEHISDRPLMIVRCPGGVGKISFHQKHWVKGFPSAIKKVKVKGESDPFFAVDSVEGLIGLAQFGSLEIHTWNTHFDHIEHPDQWVFDLDPDTNVSWNKVVETAILFRKQLANLGLKSFVKTTGGKGLHVVVPIEPKLDWELGKNFAKALCEDLANKNPSLYLVNMSKAKRKGKIFLDYLRNGRGATAIAPYSPRSRPEATVSMPIAWKDLENGTRSDAFTLLNFAEGLSSDPWKNFYKLKQLPKR